MTTVNNEHGCNAGSMTVTAIEPVKRNVFRIYMNDEPVMRLAAADIRRLYLEEGMIISQDQFEKICELVLEKRAKKRCLDILTLRDKTEKELRKTLTEDDYPIHVIDKALDYVKQFHYVDDKRYAVRFIEAKSKNKSRMQIMMMLLEKGIQSELIEEAYDEAETEDSTGLIRKLADKRKYDPENADEKETRKLYQYLMRKGFSYHEILSAFEEENS